MGVVTIKSMSVSIEKLVHIWVVWNNGLDVPALTASNIGYEKNTFSSAHEVVIESNHLSLIFGNNGLDAPGMEEFYQRSTRKKTV